MSYSCCFLAMQPFSCLSLSCCFLGTGSLVGNTRRLKAMNEPGTRSPSACTGCNDASRNITSTRDTMRVCNCTFNN